MASDGQIVFEVTADGKHAIADIKEITRAIQQETGKWDAAAKESADGMNNAFDGMLKKLAAGFSAVKIGKALLDFGADALQAASDLQEVQNVVDVTFGSNSNKIEEWARNASSAFGLTETQAKKFSSTMGAMLKSSGMAGDEIVKVSTDLAGLAADMASFYNLDFEEAFNKIRSGMSGMTMPLKELGIDMSNATLNAFALAQGMDKTFDQMTQSEQTMLRYQYLMQATADAQGDFARTSDGYANSMRTLQTNVDRLKTTLGQPFLDVVSGAVGALNEFLDILIPKEKEKTVLDDFAEIDLHTEEKLAEIRSTAEEARILTEELDKIGGTKTREAGSAVQQLATDLSNIDFDQSKVGVFSDFIGVLSENVDTIAAMQGTSNEEAKKWLEGLAKSANELDENDVEGWKLLLQTLSEGLPGFEGTDFGSKFFSVLAGEFNDVETQASVLEWAVANLGDKTNKTAQEQALWLETCKRLVQTIPGLSSIINTETGEVKGGTQAIYDYIEAWEKGQSRLALMGAIEKKESALSTKYSQLPELELDVALAESKARKAKEKLDAIYKKYGITGEYRNIQFYEAEKMGIGPTTDRIEANKAYREWQQLEWEAEASRQKYQKQVDAYNEAKKALEEYRQAVKETYGDENALAQASEDYWSKAADNIKVLTEAAQEAMTALTDYVQQVRDSVAASIESTTKGFEFIGDASQRQAKRLEPLEKELKNLQDEGKELGDINQRISNAQDTYGIGNLRKNLQSQLNFLREYKQDMEQARAKGFSNEFLAQFADGSVESAEWLHELANASSDQVKELNNLYGEVKQGKEELTGTLTEQKLSVDEVYQTLAEKAREAIDALNLATPAAENAGNTVEAVAEGIKNHVPDVADAVDMVIAELNRLNGWGITLDFNSFGNVDSIFASVTSEKSFATGIPFVPHDMYARIHEGERILTAQENQIYTALLNGGVSGVDFDALGGVMKDNVKAGGNVYLDGKVVGSVISDRQGRNYKSLQRSGWQS